MNTCANCGCQISKKAIRCRPCNYRVNLDAHGRFYYPFVPLPTGLPVAALAAGIPFANLVRGVRREPGRLIFEYDDA